MDPVESSRLSLLLALAFLVVVAGGVADLMLDAPSRWLSFHVVFELVLIALSLGLALYLARGWYITSRSLEEIRLVLGERQAERDAWRESARKVLQGLGHAIDRQFRAWDLTPTEREVALFLLKGYSHKRMARLTGRSERTVRQHSVAVYRKSGLSGRAEFAGFFLEDLLLPEDAQESLSAVEPTH